MTGKSIEYYLKKLEEYRTREDKSRSEMADELGISLGTYRNWYRGKNRNSPSSKYTKWINNFLSTREIISVDKFLEKDGLDLLERIGFEKGQSVLDFGSGRGDYSLILARTVGKEGKVYAIDKNREVLGELMGRARGNGLRNIEAKFVPAKTELPTEIPLPDKSIDAGWFSDILHDGYFKKDEEKEELLRDVYRTLKEEGFIAIHPVHMEEKKLKGVIKSTGFYLEEEYREVVLFHGNEFHEGQIFKFEKVR